MFQNMVDMPMPEIKDFDCPGSCGRKLGLSVTKDGRGKAICMLCGVLIDYDGTYANLEYILEHWPT